MVEQSRVRLTDHMLEGFDYELESVGRRGPAGRMVEWLGERSRPEQALLGANVAAAALICVLGGVAVLGGFDSALSSRPLGTAVVETVEDPSDGVVSVPATLPGRPAVTVSPSVAVGQVLADVARGPVSPEGTSANPATSMVEATVATVAPREVRPVAPAVTDLPGSTTSTSEAEAPEVVVPVTVATTETTPTTEPETEAVEPETEAEAVEPETETEAEAVEPETETEAVEPETETETETEAVEPETETVEPICDLVDVPAEDIEAVDLMNRLGSTTDQNVIDNAVGLAYVIETLAEGGDPGVSLAEAFEFFKQACGQ